jgi:LysM repeat protein
MKLHNHKSPEVPEELKPTSISFKAAFWVVFAIHMIIGVGFAASPVIAAKAKESKKQLEEDKKALEEATSVYIGIAEVTPTPVAVTTPAPTPTPIPKQTNDSHWPHGKEQPIKKTNTLTKEYIVMPGDTFYSIVKKYKLNPIKLQQINKIADTSKLSVGQRLKFF